MTDLSSTDNWRRISEQAHTKIFAQPVQSSTGPTTTYLDGIGMLLCRAKHHLLVPECRDIWEDWLTTQVRPRYHLVGLGQSGAVLLAMLGGGTLIKPPYKDHGLEYYGYLPEPGSPVCLVDDCSFTGSSLKYMREWCDKYKLVVKQEVVCIDKRDTYAGAVAQGA